MGALVTNNAVGVLASSMSDSTTTLVLSSGQGALFPNPSGADYFYVTVIDASNNKEIMKCSARSTNTLTVVRAQDNTSARAFTTGDRVELRPIAALHANYAQKDSANTFVGNQTVTGDIDVSGDVASATGHIDDLEIETMEVNGDAGTDRVIEFQTDGGTRWRVKANSTAESGSNAGSDLEVKCYSDAEALLQTALTIARATGIMTVLAGFKIGSNKGDAFPTGTKLIFPQAAAPAGWVQDSDTNDRMLRIVSSAGGGKAGSWAIGGLSIDSHVLTADELPTHKHFMYVNKSGSTSSTPRVTNITSPYVNIGGGGDFSYEASGDNTVPTLGLTSPVGGDQGHTHGLTTDSSWRPSYLDAIKCSKS